MHTLHHFARHRPRLASALVLGVIIGCSVPGHWPVVTRGLIGWNVMVWSYLILMGWLMANASHARVCSIAEQEDRSAIAVLVILSAASIASLAAIIIELSTLKALPFSDKLWRYAFTGSTVIGSWALVAILFTFHYAHMFYRSPPMQRALAFPDKECNPDYWDFMYFAFTIAVAAQTSDVMVMSRAVRKTVLAQSVLSFLYNVAIVGLSINIAASLIGG